MNCQLCNCRKPISEWKTRCLLANHMNGRPWIYAERLHLLRVSADVPTFKIMNYESLYHIQGQRLSLCEPTHWVKRFCNDHILILIKWCNLRPTTPTTLSESNRKSTWKIDGKGRWCFFCDGLFSRVVIVSGSVMIDSLHPTPWGEHLDLKMMHFPTRCETRSLNLFLETINLYMMTISMSLVWDHAPLTCISATKPTFYP